MYKIINMTSKNLSALRGESTSLADSPCIGWCTTRQFGETRCKGCGRYDFEVDSTYWNSLPDWERKLINLRNAEDGFQIKQLMGSARPIPKATANKPTKDNPTTKY